MNTETTRANVYTKGKLYLLQTFLNDGKLYSKPVYSSFVVAKKVPRYAIVMFVGHLPLNISPSAHPMKCWIQVMYKDMVGWCVGWFDEIKGE